MSRRTRATALLAGIVCAWSTAVLGGGYVFINNRLVNTDINPPLAPASRADCDDFRTQSQSTLKALAEAHDACLSQSCNGDCGFSGPLYDARKGSKCSKPACQSLHNSRDEVQEAISTGHSKCMAQVRADEADERSRAAGPEPRYDDFRDAISRIASGPAAAARRVVRAKVNDVIGYAFGPASPYIRGGIKVGATSAYLWNHAQNIRASCGVHSATVAGECDKELVNTFESLATRVPSQLRYDPAIGLIQRAMMERLTIVLGDVSKEMENLERDIDNVTTDSAPPKRPPPPSSGRSRGARAVIEN